MFGVYVLRAMGYGFLVLLFVVGISVFTYQSAGDALINFAVTAVLCVALWAFCMSRAFRREDRIRAPRTRIPTGTPDNLP